MSNHNHSNVLDLVSKASPKKGRTPVMQAAIDGNDEVLAVLLQYGADINVRDEAGCTPLHRACQYGHKAVAQRLLKSRGVASMAIRDNDGLTPFHTAVKHCQLAIIELLLQSGADVNAPF